MMDPTPEVIVNIDESNAAQYLIEESMQRPVVIDFWADWCEPCKVLMPLLEKLATEYAGAFLLAKVNADDQQMIAQQFGVRSLPTVMVMRDGQPVDGFAGAQSEQAVREMLEKHLPSPYEAALVEATTMLEAGDAAGAVSILRGVYEDSGRRHDIAMTLVHALIEARRLDDAQVLLDAVPMVDQDPLYDQLLAQLTLAREASRSPELVALEEQIAADPENLDLLEQIAVQYSAAGQFREALESLMFILRKDLDHKDGATKKALLDTIASLGKGDPLAAEYQRKLFSLLY
ncbi:thioredoxin [Congregibacter variabilis]|uniref:Thioredoxin n=1 Tax=Congregibacter variabilis TaxID=3081200 RepID=A0ABZ0I2W2_9GAMM|nr:thioredoxin [Congregibacter sp. IMCC43200]